MAKQPSVSVVIVHHSGSEILRVCLESLFNTEYSNFQVILVDNGSNDGSVESIRRINRDRLKVIRSDVNLGFVAGNNLALKHIKSKYVMLLNNDTKVEPDWLKYLVEVMESDPSIGACQPKLLSLNDPRFFEYSGCAGGMLDVFGVPFCRGRVFDVIEEDRGQYDTTADVFWAGGAAILIKRQVLREAGVLDEIFYAHMEEIDLCWRIRLLGYRVVCVPRSIVYHLGGGTQLPEKFYLKHRNNLIMMLKNYSPPNLFRFFSGRIVLDIISFVYFPITGDTHRSFFVLKAYAWLVKNFKKVYASRCFVQKRRKISAERNTEMMVKKSVAIQHYLMKRKSFKDIYGLPRPLTHYVAKRRVKESPVN